MITDELVYTETRVWKLDHARGRAKGNSHMGKGHRVGASVYLGLMSSFFFFETPSQKQIHTMNDKPTLFQSLFWAAIFGATHAPEDSHKIWLSESLAPIMKFPTHDKLNSC